MVDFDAFDALTFDCYGTLIDWETGIAEALRPFGDASDDALLEAFARHEAAARGRAVPLIPRGAGRGAARRRPRLRLRADRRGRRPPSRPRSATGRPFADSAEALAALKRRFRLGVITNCDDDLFALSNRRLGVEFDWVDHRPAGARLQAAAGELHVRLRADRRAARAHPARRPEPVPRPRAGQGAGHDDGVDRPPPGPRGLRRDAARATAEPDLVLPDMRRCGARRLTSQARRASRRSLGER